MVVEEPGFWLAVLQIIWIDVLLSGDNAVVIALACRKLPPHQRHLGRGSRDRGRYHLPDQYSPDW